MTTTDSERMLPHWDLDSIYPGLESQPFKQAVHELATRIDDLDQFLSEHGTAQSTSSIDLNVVMSIIEGYLEHMSALMRVNTTLRLYVWCMKDTDSSNAVANHRLSELDTYNARIKQQTTQFQSWLGRQKAALSDILLKSELARSHSLYLQETAEQSRYLMSDVEESLAAELALSGMNAWSNLHGTIWSQLEVPFERDGKIEQMPMPMIQNLALYDPDANVRQRAGEAEVAAWATMREPLTAALNGVMGAKVTLAKRRGRRDVLHAALDQARIDRLTLDTMLDSIRDALPSFQVYLKTKAKVLRKESLSWWDIEAPMGQIEHRFTFPEAQTFITTHFGRFSPRLGAFAKRLFELNWIDAEPRAGKQGGAYCRVALGTGISRILCNFDGSLAQVIAIAHELGHAFHWDCQTGKTYQQAQTPMTLNESASLFCETLVTDQAIANAASPQEELALLNTFLGTATLTTVTSTSMYYFEKEVLERRERSELSADEICETSQRHQAALYGVDPNRLHPYFWASIPHCFFPHISFYNFPYAFGLLFSLGLYAQYQQRGAAFVPDYEALLESTGEFIPSDLAARFGINLREPGYWQASLGLIEKRIQRFQELCIAPTGQQ